MKSTPFATAPLFPGVPLRVRSSVTSVSTFLVHVLTYDELLALVLPTRGVRYFLALFHGRSRLHCRPGRSSHARECGTVLGARRILRMVLPALPQQEPGPDGRRCVRRIRFGGAASGLLHVRAALVATPSPGHSAIYRCCLFCFADPLLAPSRTSASAWSSCAGSLRSAQHRSPRCCRSLRYKGKALRRGRWWSPC